MRTSASHPLQIAELMIGDGHGRIGITFCPGKYDPHAASGAWRRDLDLDLDAISAWGAAAVVTLVEPRELTMLRVEGLGDAVRLRQMLWYHLPIVDVSTPDQAFEDAWHDAGESLRAVLRSGFDVVVHCRGGLGRAGTIAARLLIELGAEPISAVKQVRKARPGAIETPNQKKYVLTHGAVPERRPAAEAVRDRAYGALLGLAVGDALGMPLEFLARDTYPPLQDMIGGGRHGLEAGEWTDDTSMALCLADSLIASDGTLDPGDLMQRFVRWRDHGDNVVNGRACFDIGNTVRAALDHFARDGEPIAGPTDPRSAGNGSLMRLAPVPIRFSHDLPRLREIAALQSRTTHGAREAVEACVLFAEIVAEAIAGAPRSEVLRPRVIEGLSEEVAAIAAGRWRGKPRAAIGSTGYVLHSLEAALWAVGSTADFESAVLKAANLGLDADSTAAIAGQLAGALYGLGGIPERWLLQLAQRDRIMARAEALVAQAQAEQQRTGAAAPAAF